MDIKSLILLTMGLRGAGARELPRQTERRCSRLITLRNDMNLHGVVESKKVSSH